MELQPADTDPEAYEVWLAVLRNLTPGQRLLNTLRLSERSRELSLVGIGLRHPEYTLRERELALRRWSWGERVFQEVYPEGPFLEP